MPGRALAPIPLALLVGLFACFIFAKPASPLPSGFSDARVADVFQPTALAFTPDGRMLITTKPGKLHVFDQSGNALASPALDLGSGVCDNSERGLLGVAVDPGFEEEGHDYVYLYYTARGDTSCHNRVSRFEMNGNTVDQSTERVLIDKIHSTHGNHNGGDLKFGKDLAIVLPLFLERSHGATSHSNFFWPIGPRPTLHCSPDLDVVVLNTIRSEALCQRVSASTL